MIVANVIKLAQNSKEVEMVLSNEELRQLTAKTAILLSPKLHFQPSVLLYCYDAFRNINIGILLIFADIFYCHYS